MDRSRNREELISDYENQTLETLSETRKSFTGLESCAWDIFIHDSFQNPLHDPFSSVEARQKELISDYENQTLETLSETRKSFTGLESCAWDIFIHDSFQNPLHDPFSSVEARQKNMYVSHITGAAKKQMLETLFEIRKSFPGVESCVLAYDHHGNFQHSLLVSFSSVEARQKAMKRSGELIAGSPIIMSIMEMSVPMAFSFVVLGLPPHAKISEISKHFKSDDVNQKHPVVHRPADKLKNKGSYCVVHVGSRDHLMECFAKDNSRLAGKPIRVLPGLFPDGNGLKFVSVATFDHLMERLALDQTYLAHKKIRVVAALYPDGKGLKFKTD